LCRDGISLSTGRQRSKKIQGMASPFPSPDDSFARLHLAGWSIGEIATAGGWQVTGSNRENLVRATGKSQAEAWYRAVERAEAVGMAGRNRKGNSRYAGGAETFAVCDHEHTQTGSPARRATGAKVVMPCLHPCNQHGW
jgi:hypothetical protein